MVISLHEYKEVATGSKRNAVCKDYGRNFNSYILSAQLLTFLSDFSWLGEHSLVSFG